MCVNPCKQSVWGAYDKFLKKREVVLISTSDRTVEWDEKQAILKMLI